MANRFLGTVTLRGEHEVWLRDDGAYEVIVVDARGVRHGYPVLNETVEWLKGRLSDREVDVSEAAEALEPVATQLGLPFTYGHKLKFYAQEVLVVMVARREASVRKEGRRYVYSLYGRTPEHGA